MRTALLIAAISAGVLLSVARVVTRVVPEPSRLWQRGFLAGARGPGPADLEALKMRINALEAQVARSPQTTLEAQVDSLQEEIARLRTELAGSARLLQSYPFPEEVVFCGDPVPLHDPEVRRRFEEEFYRLLTNRHWLLAWMRRSEQVFPIVEARLREAGLPEDLKYVMVIESGVRSRATSPAGAAGYWQFVRNTGRRFGLRLSRYVDERRSLGRSTDAAIVYLRELREAFGSWPLALAGFNAGKKRVADAIRSQGTHDYYSMVLPQETEAYWFRAAAVKVFFEHAGDYGLYLPALASGQEALYDTLRIRVRSKPLPLKDVAEASGISYRRLKELNPHFRRSTLPSGTYTLAIPREGVEGVLRHIRDARVAARAVAGGRSAARGAWLTLQAADGEGVADAELPASVP